MTRRSKPKSRRTPRPTPSVGDFITRLAPSLRGLAELDPEINRQLAILDTAPLTLLNLKAFRVGFMAGAGGLIEKAPRAFLTPGEAVEAAAMTAAADTTEPRKKTRSPKP